MTAKEAFKIKKRDMAIRLWPRLVQWLLVLALPVLLLTVDLRIVTGHWFVRWEYGKADFPPDPFGLSVAERTHLAEVCVEYLATNADISLLAELRLPDGEFAFNDRELRHMADVQTVYHGIMIAGTSAGFVFLIGITTLLVASQARGQTDGHSMRRRAASALLSGSLFTVGLLGAVGAVMALNWGDFFTTFHRIFFEGETWIFPYSDTLIRLFPMRFWMDVAVTIVVFLLIGAALVGALGWTWKRRRDSRA